MSINALYGNDTLFTYHPSVTKAAGNKGYRAMIRLHDGTGRMVGSRISRLVFLTKEAARNYARVICNSPTHRILERLDGDDVPADQAGMGNTILAQSHE
jgi:hypothetical protein